MPELWVKLEKTLPPNAKKKVVGSCKELFDVLFVDTIDSEVHGEELRIASPEGRDIFIFDLSNLDKLDKAKKQGRTVGLYAHVSRKEDLDMLIKNALKFTPDYLVVSCLNWKIVPLENLVASLKGKCKIIAEVKSAEEARTVMDVLELGVDGVLVASTKEDEIKAVREVLRTKAGKLNLVRGEVIEVKALSSGLRACIDTCEIMNEGEGMLVGSYSSGLFLIEAEVAKSPFTSPREFRVNAGAISSYILMSNGSTKYLSEVRAGDEVLIVNRDGSTRVGIVARVKIERRPLLMITAVADGNEYRVIVQNAETIRLVSTKGSKSVTELKPGDEVLMKVERGGRHFGVLVREEFVIEQ